MKAPEKIFLHPDIGGREFIRPWLKRRANQESVEYTRTDAFVDKAAKWIEEINNHHHIMRYSDSCEPSLSELTEWFRNYMKGE